MNKILTFLFILFLPLISDAQSESEKPTLLIEISNIKKAKGSIKIAVYDHKDRFLGDELLLGKSIEVTNSGSMIIPLEELPHGTYAISLYHDKNNNDKLDTNFIGIPNEPYGFSNNARGTFGPPKFEKAKFHFNPLLGKIRVKLK